MLMNEQVARQRFEHQQRVDVETRCVTDADERSSRWRGSGSNMSSAMTSRHVVLQMLMNEQVARQRFEHEQRDDVERRWEALKQLTDDEMTGIREAIKVTTPRHVSSLSEWCCKQFR